MTNQFPGLARGPIDHEASSLINVTAKGKIDMGSAVFLVDETIPSSAIFPRVEQSIISSGSNQVYGIAVGGDTDGIYGDGSASADEDDRFVAAQDGESVVVCTQGRCLAKINSPTGAGIGGDLIAHSDGTLRAAITGSFIIAKSLFTTASNAEDMILVDIQRIGEKTT